MWPTDPEKIMECRRKMSLSQKKRFQREKNPMEGRHLSDEAKEKIRKAHLGKKLSEEHKKKLSESRRGEKNWNKGKKMSDEQKKKISESRKGIPLSAIAIENIRQAVLRRPPMSEEVKRKISEAQKGERGNNWKGGISFEPYCIKFNKEFKERVRKFFGHRCVECGSIGTPKKLHVHHVNFDKQTCCNTSVPLFVPLCPSCHSKTQFDRAFWEDWFTEIINEFYGGKCYESVSNPHASEDAREQYQNVTAEISTGTAGLNQAVQNITGG